MGSSMVMIFRSTSLMLRQARVQRGGLAAAGGPGHQHDPVRQVQDPLDDRAVVRRHAQMLHPQQHRAAVQQSQHHGLAVEHRDHRHAHVHLARGDLELDPAVLRQTFFGDVQVREDLQA